MEMSFGVCIPTLNASSSWPEFANRLKALGSTPVRVLLIDSESTDGTADLAKKEGFQVVEIARKDFHHGATRQLGVELLEDVDVIVFLTQDALLASIDAISRLVSRFKDPEVGAAYGRQLPRDGAGPIEAHARLFNYPEKSGIRTLKGVDTLGFKSIFFSNSFGAYRRSALMKVGGFPKDVNFGEDTVVAARLLLAGWKVAYAADAAVYHSHAYTIAEEYRRYVQIGQLHASQAWLLEKFGRVNGEGMRFMRSQLAMLAREAPMQIPGAILRAAAKWVGYRSGTMFHNA